MEWTGMMEWNGGMDWNSGMEGWWVLLSAHEPLEAAPQRFPLHLLLLHHCPTLLLFDAYVNIWCYSNNVGCDPTNPT